MNKSSVDADRADKGFTKEERAAMKERARELKSQARANKDKTDGESAVLQKIAEMPEPERNMATRLHEIIKDCAPTLTPKTWYGMPAYANREGRVICFFQAASKFNTRYSTLGFQHDALLDEGNMWPVAFALLKLTPAEEKKIRTLIKKAVG